MNVEKYSILELDFTGAADGDPEVDHTILGTFLHEKEEVTVPGSYEGNGIYKVRFTPSYTGHYRYRVYGTFSKEIRTGSFDVVTAASSRHMKL